MKNPPLLVLAAGGTGGHMFPAQAVAEVMLKRGWRVVLSTDARGARYTSGFPSEVEIEQVSSATFAKGGLLNKIMVPIRIAIGVTAARRKMRRTRPNVVVGFGGYPAIPAMGAATSLGIPCMLHEQNGVLGRVNQLFASRVNQIACGTWPTKLPDGLTGHHIGNPVRQEILDRHGAGYIAPGDYPMDVLVIGGSQGARILSDVVPAAVGLLPGSLRQNLRISQQAREEDCSSRRTGLCRDRRAGRRATVFQRYPGSHEPSAAGDQPLWSLLSSRYCHDWAACHFRPSCSGHTR